MKSILQEASSLAKAIEQGWIKAGKPKDFSVKIYEEPETNFFGFVTKKAKVGIFYHDKQQTPQGRYPRKHAPQQRRLHHRRDQWRRQEGGQQRHGEEKQREERSFQSADRRQEHRQPHQKQHHERSGHQVQQRELQHKPTPDDQPKDNNE